MMGVHILKVRLQLVQFPSRFGSEERLKTPRRFAGQSISWKIIYKAPGVTSSPVDPTDSLQQIMINLQLALSKHFVRQHLPLSKKLCQI
jgi:uncharacterized protein (DUF4213/DUF364 family)